MSVATGSTALARKWPKLVRSVAAQRKRDQKRPKTKGFVALEWKKPQFEAGDFKLPETLSSFTIVYNKKGEGFASIRKFLQLYAPKITYQNPGLEYEVDTTPGAREPMVVLQFKSGKTEQIQCGGLRDIAVWESVKKQASAPENQEAQA